MQISAPKSMVTSLSLIQKGKKNTHFKQKPFNSLTTKLRTFPLSPLRAGGHVFKELLHKHRQRKVNLFISKFVKVKWSVGKLTKCETSRLCLAYLLMLSDFFC